MERLIVPFLYSLPLSSDKECGWTRHIAICFSSLVVAVLHLFCPCASVKSATLDLKKRRIFGLEMNA